LQFPRFALICREFSIDFRGEIECAVNIFWQPPQRRAPLWFLAWPLQYSMGAHPLPQ
jgi:hypothetical protein